MSKKVRGLFQVLFALTMLFATLAPAASAVDLDTNARPEIGNLVIHKTQFHGADIPTIPNHDGEELTQAEFPYAPLAGAEFTVYKVDDDLEDIPTDFDDLVLIGAKTTLAAGSVEFDALEAGRYLVVETARPRGVNYFSPSFLVDVPMTNAAGTAWLETVHVYAKNQVALASVGFTKAFEAKEGTKTATFALYKVGETADTLIETKTITVPDGQTRGAVYFDGVELGLETGDYYIIEESVSDPYGVNPNRITFTVEVTDHDEDLTDTVPSIRPLGESVFNNYTTSTPVKENTDDDNDEDSANIGEIVEWKLSARIPENISTYDTFTFVDDIDERLNYVPGSVEIAVGEDDGEALATIVEPTTASGGQLQIVFSPTALAAYKGQTVEVTFHTTINETAVMGQDIPNKFDLTFDNGSGLTTKTSPPVVTKTGGAKFDKTSVRELENYSGAQFHIYRGTGATKEYLQANQTWAAANTNPFVLTSIADGTFEITGLSYGTYVLEEVVALPGHMLRADFQFTVDDDSYKIAPREVLNVPQIQLPSTGGMGTIMFTIAGIGMMLGAVKLYRKEEA